MFLWNGSLKCFGGLYEGNVFWSWEFGFFGFIERIGWKIEGWK